MKRGEQEVQVREEGWINGTISSHPAFGAIVVSRAQGSGEMLYGSEVPHHTAIFLTVTESEHHRGLHTDAHHPKKHLIEVMMTEAQFAHIIGSVGVGGGTPVTIRYVAGEEGLRPRIPMKRAGENFRQEAKESFEGMAKKVRETIEDVEGEIGASLSKVKRERILSRLNRLHSELTNGLPFMAGQFAEHMENVVEEAKAEVNAYRHHAANNLLLEATRKGELPAPIQD